MPFESADQVVTQAVSWLWENRIPLDKLLILDGDPDLGKSLVVLDLCARLSTGRPFPDGRPGSGPANALVLSAEDTPSDTIVPRLHRLGADLGRVFVWERERDDEDYYDVADLQPTNHDLEAFGSVRDHERRASGRKKKGLSLMVRIVRLVVVEATTNRIRMLGSLRASKQCLECHRGHYGALLGAFSYELLRDPRKPTE